VRWLVATVAETVPETARAVTLRLDVPDWPGHRAGQHVDVRLTAEDGYSAQRSYSIASPPGSERLEPTVERIDDGEVSPYLTTVADLGDRFELRGPIGGWFVWDGADSAPVLLVGGGSGVVPLRPDPPRFMAQSHQGVGDRLDERGGPAHVAVRLHRRRPAHLGEQAGIDAAQVPGPARRRLPGEGQGHRPARARQHLELVAVDEIAGCARRVHQVHRRRAVRRGVVAQDRSERFGPTGG
jgi:hypothetical protein